MRSVYIDYSDLYEKHENTIEKTIEDLKARAMNFYESKIRDIGVSDIIYPPSEMLIDDIV